MFRKCQKYFFKNFCFVVSYEMIKFTTHSDGAKFQFCNQNLQEKSQRTLLCISWNSRKPSQILPSLCPQAKLLELTISHEIQ